MTRNIQALQLYKNLLRESQKMSNYNFRMYALRRIRDAFKENKALTDIDIVEEKYKFGLENLEIIKRQVIIGKLYESPKLIIENKASSSSKATG